MFVFLAIVRGWHNNKQQASGYAEEAPPSVSHHRRNSSLTTLASFMPRQVSERTRCRRRIWQLGVSLLCFPVIYTVLALPLSVARTLEMANHRPSNAYIWISASLYTCGGWCNVILYTATREGVIPWNWFLWRRWFPQVLSDYLYPHHHIINYVDLKFKK